MSESAQNWLVLLLLIALLVGRCVYIYFRWIKRR